MYTAFTATVMGLGPSAKSRCGAEEQTVDHILDSCPLCHLLNGTLGLAALDGDIVDWLKRIATEHLMTRSAHENEEDCNCLFIS